MLPDTLIENKNKSWWQWINLISRSALSSKIKHENKHALIIMTLINIIMHDDVNMALSIAFNKFKSDNLLQSFLACYPLINS